ncbi:undecaprenyl-diphosphate phosphatase [Candidatus Enterovibrio escicola]|uniref:Undecaprenyl-diphosphatase n=3 Tax=Candidatus Enterovibrio escicola TaxID=1927127 RepID=A0A2A5T3L2_9GAMM|nr:undecaprenyl-diphosphate phosphatase [Candidatus Enterovibrio escacola]PCS22742.1 Undecaprenyl-diphosphatase [Candidatus Enterovibrio escacola]
MSMFETCTLALIQGLTEFLPISSSAHLILPSQILGWQDQGLGFDVSVHIGTLLAVVGYLRKEVKQLLGALFRWIFNGEHSPDATLAWMITLSTIPAGIFGLLMKNFVEIYLRSAWVITATCIIFGLLLWWVDVYARCEDDEYTTTPKSALLIGLAQAIAIIPGASRSGMTMTMALYIGYTREAAARFSFLMSIPIIVLAGSYLGLGWIQSDVPILWKPILVGIFVSFFSAYICIHWFLKLITNIGMKPFIIYRMVLGTGLAIFLATK